ncbi:hypothetical protein AAII07_54310 [Microvirga sp. 0TCS3.31]
MALTLGRKVESLSQYHLQNPLTVRWRALTGTRGCRRRLGESSVQIE